MKRVLSALVGIPLVVAAVFFADRDLFRWITAALCLLAVREYLELCDLRGLMAAATLAGSGVIVASAQSERVFLLSGFSLIAVLASSLWQVDNLEERFRSLAEAVLGMTYLSLAFSSLLFLRELQGGASWLMVILLVLWSGDTAAYYGGSKFGKRKLAPLISPNKTWEGTAWGLFASVLFGTLAAFLLLGEVPLGRVAMLCLLVGVSGQLGDLLESLWKRAKGVKDSGNLIPGHGGLLDRIDSLMLGAPVGYHLVKGWVTGT